LGPAQQGSAEENLSLGKVKEEFLTFERDGLGVTSMERHSIELMEGAKGGRR